ncbi:alpha/beta fold hydrolase [bacterium]|nr:MAG: alpha/beta fold hydrolase [bacterium]
MRRLNVVLVHGFSGAPSDLESLFRELVSVLGEEAVRRITLPGHSGNGGNFRFNREVLVGEVLRVLAGLEKDGRLVVVGHSTGGNIALEAISQAGLKPELVVLAATPCAIDLSYHERWQRHRDGREEITFSSVAGLLSLINATGAMGPTRPFPALILQGEDDDLITPGEARKWAEKFNGGVQMVMVPGGGHHLFTGPCSPGVVETVVRAITGRRDTGSYPEECIRLLEEVEPEVRRFLDNSTGSAYHLAGCPSGRRVMGKAPQLPASVDWEPVFANIEITTRCNLACRFCARTGVKRRDKDMSEEIFAGLLDRLPHAYRVTLVGLGEPLLHPRVADLIAHASGRGRRTALVTNGMLLTKKLGAGLLDGGLDSIAFSIDAAEPALANRLRQGTELDRIVENIRVFTQLARQAHRPISTAVFSAVSRDSVEGLADLAELVASLGVHVLMLTDLNYPFNQTASLCGNIDPHIARLVRKGVKSAFSRNLPVLTVRGLEEFGQAVRWRESILLPPDQLYIRSGQHSFCYSPWQTVAVDVDGAVTLCDCQPNSPVGNLFVTPLEEIWNGQALRDHRRRMVGDDPPEACRVCPRF